MGLNYLDVVTIDGPAGAGKSSVAKTVAKALDYTFLDTGAMYRAIALGAIGKGLVAHDSHPLDQYLEGIDLVIKPDPDTMGLILNGVEVTHAIRSPEMGRHASDFSTLKAVRAVCSRLQRRMGEQGCIVCEGRDMGTVVFPDARWKFFLTASVDQRAQRRWLELKDRGEAQDFEQLKTAIAQRDTQDSERKIAPLKAADDAEIVDTTNMSFDGVVSFILNRIAA